jgi:hypothetical protein
MGVVHIKWVIWFSFVKKKKGKITKGQVANDA